VIQLKKIKFNFFSSLFFLVSFCFLLPLNIKAEQSEAIAVRILENPSHYSSLRWYEAQNFQGSPQLLQVDGYDAVRNGRTVYVDVANVVDKNGDGVPDYLYTNILVLSYNQDAGGATIDIFGQLLKNFKFNTNLSDLGICSKNNSVSCLNDSDCPTADYCLSKKAKVIRDVKRLADLEEIKARLNNYKKQNNNYPTMQAGSYIVGKTLSTWPSWQKSLGQALGMSLPVDPLNQLGACPGLDSVTCWDEKTQKFATDLSQSLLPSNSHAYAYIGDGQGKVAKYCAQIESNYSNIDIFNCFKDTQVNSRPTIGDVNLVGRSMDEFVGYVTVADADGDPVKLTIDLVNPDSNTWLARKWQWGAGFNKFSVMTLPGTGQRRLYAAKTGNVGEIGYYKIRLTVDDGRGEANSTFSKDFDVRVDPFPMTLEKGDKTVVVGNSDSIAVSGTDANKDPLNNLHFQSATFNGNPIDQATFTSSGFAISGMSVTENFKPAQRIGVYAINLYSLDPTIPTLRVNSNVTFTIINHPPVFQRLTATFSNNTTQTCNPGDSCSVAIDNSEKATVKIIGSDPDNHQLNYSLVDNLNGQLSIDPNSGVISGFEKLNFQKLSDQNFNVIVKIGDQYCNNSSEAECSSVYSFNVLVKKFCSINVPESMTYVESSQTFTVNNSGETFDTGLNLTDCSQIGSSSVDIKLVGKPNSKAIVLVSDLSSSMDSNIVGVSAINRLKTALAADQTGFLDRIYNIINGWPSEHAIKIGLVAYNADVVSYQVLINLALTGSLTNLKTIINSYSTGYQTNTLKALNKAEELLAPVTDPNIEKIIILMSDGIPGVDGYTITDPQVIDESCNCGGDYPSCVECCNVLCKYNIPATDPACTKPETCDPILQYSSCGKCYNRTCSCSGTYPNCTEPDYNCGPGEVPWYCGQCYTPGVPPHSVYNNLQKVKRFFTRLFETKTALATTVQNQCIYKSCAAAFPNISYNSTYQYLSCSYQYIVNCDLTPDVDLEAAAIKKLGISLYTIYYNTSGDLIPKQKMCNWSSNNGLNCDNNTNTFAGTDINIMINKVLGRIITKPKDVAVASSDVVDSDPTAIISYANGTSLTGLSCGAVKPLVKYTNSGYLELSNLKLNYCGARLHS
jgi:hypothetical protein